jgi:hypothetical protein
MQSGKQSERNLRVGAFLAAAVALYIVALVGYMILR